MFQVGQHVLRVKVPPADWERRTDRQYGYGDEQKPVVGTVYTVRSIRNDLYPELALLVEEIVNPVRGYTLHDGRQAIIEPHWPVRSFRPLSSDRLSIFRQHLAPLSTDKVEA